MDVQEDWLHNVSLQYMVRRKFLHKRLPLLHSFRKFVLRLLPRSVNLSELTNLFVSGSKAIIIDILIRNEN